MNEIHGQIATVHSGLIETIDEIGSRVSVVNQDSKRSGKLRAEISERLATLQKYSTQLHAKNKALTEQIESFNVDHATKTRKLDEANDEVCQHLDNLEGKSAGIQNQIKTASENIHDQKCECERLEENETDLDSKLATLQERVDAFLSHPCYIPEEEVKHEKRNLEAIDAKIVTTKTHIINLDQKKITLADVQLLSEKASTFQQKNSEICEMKSQIEEKMTIQRDSIESKTETLNSMTSQLALLQKTLKELQDMELVREQISQERDKLIKETESLQQNIPELEQTITTLEIDLNTCDESGSKIDADIAELEAKIQEIEQNPENVAYKQLEAEFASVTCAIEGNVGEEEKLENHLKDLLDNFVINEAELVTEEELTLMKKPQVQLNDSVLSTHEEIALLLVEIENLHQILNVLTAEKMRLEHDIHHQEKKKRHYEKLVCEFRENPVKTHRRKIRAMIRKIVDSITEMKKVKKSRRRMIAVKKTEIDQIFAARRFRSVTAVGEDAQMETLSLMLDSRIMSWKLVCESLSWVYEMFTMHKSRIGAISEPVSTFLKEWQVSLESIYTKSDDIIILAYCYLIE